MKGTIATLVLTSWVLQAYAVRLFEQGKLEEQRTVLAIAGNLVSIALLFASWKVWLINAGVQAGAGLCYGIFQSKKIARLMGDFTE